MLDTKVGTVSVKCPHCGFVNDMWVDAEDLGKLRVYWCNLEEGGCDAPLVVCPTATVTATVYTISKDPVNETA
jgi:hypothetical protein